MKRISLIAILICSSIISYGQNMDSFRFLLGNWSLERPSGRIAESWIRNAAGYSGTSHKITASGDSVLMETMILKADAGQIFFIPTTAGQNNAKPVIFKLVSANDKFFVFENRLHDFPTKVVYQNKSPDELFAWIEGTVNGSVVKMEYPYLREKTQ